jgi:hypothetical protein
MGSGRELRQHDVSDFLRFCTELAFPGKNFAPGCPRNGKCQLARPIASPAFRPSAAFARNSRAPTGRDSSKLFAGFTHMPFCIVEFVGKHCTSSNTTFLTSAQPPQQPHHFHVPPTLSLQPPRRTHLLQVSIQVQLQQIPWIVAGPPRLGPARHAQNPMPLPPISPRMLQ